MVGVGAGAGMRGCGLGLETGGGPRRALHGASNMGAGGSHGHVRRAARGPDGSKQERCLRLSSNGTVLLDTLWGRTRSIRRAAARAGSDPTRLPGPSPTPAACRSLAARSLACSSTRPSREPPTRRSYRLSPTRRSRSPRLRP